MSQAFEDFLRNLPELKAQGLAPDWAIDQQGRSRRTRARILRGAALLVQERPFQDVSMQDLARRAGVSVGAIYARFPSKDAVLVLLGAAVLDLIRDAFVRALDALPAGTDPRELVRAYVATMTEQLRRHRRLILELRRSAGADPALARLVGRTNEGIHEAFRDRVRPLLPQIPHPRPAEAVEYVLFLTGSCVREAVLAGALAGYPVPGDDAALIGEVTGAASAYLGLVTREGGGAGSPVPHARL